MRIVAVLLTWLLIAGCTSVPEDASGEEIFSLVCARCHGSNLEGGVGPKLAGADAPSADKPDDYLTTTISRGKGRMPAFRATLSEEQIERVVGYVREQQTG
jgi:mono/diheme cytochrome c family protein